MDKETKCGSELGALSKILFDKAVCSWYLAIGIEVVAGGLAVAANIANGSDTTGTIFAILGFLLLVLAYYLKEKFYTQYDNAEAMRRESVLNLSMSWPISRTKMSEWRRCCGKEIALNDTSLEDDYYETKEPPSPNKLLQMTQESAFWTRHLYNYLKNYVLVGFILSLFILFSIITFAASGITQSNVSLKIVYVVYLILPIVLSVDMLGWFLRLNRLAKNILSVENDLESLEKELTINEQKVLVLVAEYNSQVISGFPVPSWFFKKYHDLISKLWKKR